MLTRRHLSVIRAALRFWAEEMHPYDGGLIAAYCQRSEQDDDFPDADDVEWMTENIDRLELLFALVSVDHSGVIHDRLFDSAEAAEQARGTTKGDVASVLVLRD